MKLKTIAIIGSTAVVVSTGWAESKQFTVFPRPGGSSAVRIYIQADDATSANGTWSATKATLKITINGKDLEIDGHEVPAVPIGKIDGVVESNGYATGGTYTFSRDTKVPDVLKTGVAFSIKKDSKLTLSTTGPINFSGAAKLVLPFKGKSVSGGTTKTDLNIEVDLKDIVANPNTIDFEATCDRVEFGGLQANIEVDHPDAKISIPTNGPATFDLHAATASAYVGSPTTASVGDPSLKLAVMELHVDSDSQVTFKQATGTFGSDGAPATWASLQLAAPVDFNLLIHKVTVEMDHSNFKTFTIDDGAVELPSQFSATDKSSGTPDRVRIAFTASDLVRSPIIQLKAPDANVDIYWNSFHLQLPKSAQSVAVLDLSDSQGDPTETFVDPSDKKTVNPLPATWQGLYIPKLKLEIPSVLEDAGTQTFVDAQQFYIDGAGISGVFQSQNASGLTGGRIPSFPGTLTDLSLTISHSHLNAGAAKGKLQLADWGVALDVGLTFSDSGLFTMAVTSTTPIKIPSLNLFLQIDQGTFTFSEPKNGAASASLVLTGSLQFPNDTPDSSDLSFLNGATFSVKDLSVDSAGHLSLKSAWLDLPNATPIDFGPVKILINQIGVGEDPQKGYFLAFTGDVSLGPDLPLSGQLGFEGLYLYSKPATASATDLPEISLKGISFATSIPGVIGISGHLSNDKFPKNAVSAAGHPWANKKQVTVLNGTAQITVDALKAVGPFGGEVDFMVAPKAFALSGFLSIPSPGIQLGQTPFAIRGFGGGFGINVYGGDPNTQAPVKMVGKPGRDYKIYPLPSDYTFPSGGVGNKFLGTASLRVATSDGFTAFGDGTVTFGLGGASFVDLDAMLYIAQLGVEDENPVQDRTLHGNLHFDFPTDTFTANLAANLYVPTKSLHDSGKGAYVHGSIDVKLSPDDCHFYIGGPITEDPNHKAPKIQNPVGFDAFGIAGPGGAFTIDYNFHQPDQIHAQVAGSFAFNKTFGPQSFGFLTASAAVSASAYLYGSLDVSNQWSNIAARGYVHVDGGVDVTGSAFGQSGTLHTSLEADLGGTLNVTLKGSPSFDMTASGRVDVTFSLLGFKKKFSQDVKWPL